MGTFLRWVECDLSVHSMIQPCRDISACAPQASTHASGIAFEAATWGSHACPGSCPVPCETRDFLFRLMQVAAENNNNLLEIIIIFGGLTLCSVTERERCALLRSAALQIECC